MNMSSVKSCIAEAIGSAGSMAESEKLAGDSFLMAGPLMKAVRARAVLVAGVNVPVLVLGETGTGKDVVARLIHNLSSRAGCAFNKVNCAAVPNELLESELFGYEAGAFTGAVRAKPGRFELCNRGTLFLDEIGEMLPHIQAKLLHVLQDGKFCRLGGCSTVAANVRVIAATNVNISDALATGSLREDLYYRLSAFTIHLPPLRDRREEIPFFFRHFMKRFAAEYVLTPPAFSQALMEACLSYSWPGNVRELENFVRRFLVVGNEEAALAELGSRSVPSDGAKDPANAHGPNGAGNGLKSRLRNLKKAIEAEAILEALEHTHWNRTRAAEQLHISTRSLRYRMSQLDIHGVRASAERLSTV